MVAASNSPPPSNRDEAALAHKLTADGASVEAQVAALAKHYSERAAAYERLWSPALQPMSSRLLERLPLMDARDVIDVGTGTGAMLPALHRAAPRARILGVDNAEGMLRLAQARHEGPLALTNVERLDLDSEQFDVALIAFVLFHLPHPKRCLGEVFRVLRPAGSVGTATWGSERWPDADEIWEEELTRSGAETFRLPATANRACCDSGPKMRDLLEVAGFTSISTWSETLQHRWPPSDHFEYHVLVSSRSRLESLNSAARAACLVSIRRRLEGCPDEAYVYTGDVIMATARKPA
jgi:ubiquinone/menaquinone biosynthesis C-methylase UbiE